MSREAYPELISILSDFSTKSFTELQAAAYVALIKMGEESGSAVAGEAGINRSKIYDILGQLEEMGAVAKVSRDGKTRYVAISPDDLLPRLIDKFAEDIGKAQEGLNDIKNLKEEIDEANITLTTLNIEEINTNEFEYLITSSEKSRVKFVDNIPRDFRPQTDVKILNLNREIEGRGLIMLLGDKLVYIFGTPTGKKVEALRITSLDLIYFIRGIIVSAWVEDIPKFITDEIESGVRLAFLIDKATYVHYELYPSNQEGKYERPVTFIISDEFISFMNYEVEDPKMPLQFLQSVTLLEDDRTIMANFASPSKDIGKLQMKVVSNPYLIKNILQYIINKNNN